MIINKSLMYDLCDSIFECFLGNTVNCFFTSMKDVI